MKRREVLANALRQMPVATATVAFEQSRIGRLPEVEKFLAAIKSAAVHLQGLVNPGR